MKIIQELKKLKKTFSDIMSPPYDDDDLWLDELDDLDEVEEASADTVSLRRLGSQSDYTGYLMLRIPKELHQQLAQEAKANGVSLNEYALYKLAK